MNFERESWRPLFLREPVARRALSLFARGLRTYLLQVAEDDGRLLERCADPLDLATLLMAHPEELDSVRAAIDALLRDGFLRWDGDRENPGWLGVDRLVTFHPGEALSSPAAPDETPVERQRRLTRERKERWKHRHQRSEAVPEGVPDTVPGSVPGPVPGNVPGDLSPQSPLSDKQTNKKSERRALEGAVPASVPGNVPVSVPERGTRNAFLRPSEDPGTRGHERQEPQQDHRRLAKQLGVNLDDAVKRLGTHPRAKKLSTPEYWRALTTVIERMAADQQRLGGAA